MKKIILISLLLVLLVGCINVTQQQTVSLGNESVVKVPETKVITVYETKEEPKVTEIGEEKIQMTYDERTSKEIDRILGSGYKVAIPFDKKTIGNEEFKTFGIGVLNTFSIDNNFKVILSFSKAFDRSNKLICDSFNIKPCGINPNNWLQVSETEKIIKNNEQENFLIGVSVENAVSGTYIFDLEVKYYDGEQWLQYDTLRHLYVDVP